jgi:hypothetical protein
MTQKLMSVTIGKSKTLDDRQQSADVEEHSTLLQLLSHNAATAFSHYAIYLAKDVSCPGRQPFNVNRNIEMR